MRLVENMKKIGHYLFKYRGQVPVFLLLFSTPIIYSTNHYLTLNYFAVQIFQHIAILISVTGLLLRYITVATTPAGTSGRNRNQQIAKQLNTTGVYSLTRNPLYLANYMIWLGISIYSISYIFIIIITLFFLFHYERIILIEEDFLFKKFGKKYDIFTKKVPVFFPKFNNYKPTKIKFSTKTILRQEYSSTLSTTVSLLFIDILIQYFLYNNLENYAIETNTHVIILTISIIITLFLKIIKSYTKLLND